MRQRHSLSGGIDMRQQALHASRAAYLVLQGLGAEWHDRCPNRIPAHGGST